MQMRWVGFSGVVLFAVAGACTQNVGDTPFGVLSSDGGAESAPQSTGGGDAADGEADEGASEGAEAASDDGGSSSGAGSGAGTDTGAAEASDGGSDPSGTASTQASAGDSGGDGGGSVWEYGPCTDNPPCPMDQCMTISGFEGSFCTTACVDGACPAAPEGDALAQCLLGPDLNQPPVNCVLTCAVSEQSCPGGMTCVDAMMGGDAGICLWQG